MVEVGSHYDFTKKKKDRVEKERLVLPGTKYFFNRAADGGYTVRLMIPVRFIGAY